MKKLALFIIAVDVLLAVLFFASPQAHGQTGHAVDLFGVNGELVGFAQGVSTTKTLTVTAYPSFAPELKIDGVKRSWGFGIAALYPLGDFAFTGARLDYLGDQFWNPSVTVGCKADVQLLGHNFTPFAIGGAIFPLGGAGEDNHSLGAIVGGGVATTIWASKDGKTSVQAYYAAEKWTLFSGIIHHPGISATFRF